VLRTEVSLVSPGTELAILSGGESWAPLPFVPGYAVVGRDQKSGQRLFTHGRHEEFTAEAVLTTPVPESVAAKHAVFARIASVSMTAIRVGSIELGDWVAVFGCGVVGNIAAQLAQLAGARVIVLDKSKERLSRARQCGIDHALQADGTEIEQIRTITGGEMCSSVIEATGVTAVAETAIRAAGQNGELILLGTPRAPHQPNFLDFLRTVHIANTNVTVKGAHEWCYPVDRTKGQRDKHTIVRNTEHIMYLIETGRLRLDEITTHVITPDEAPEIYQQMERDPGSFLGVVIDWTSEEKKS
jgi:threonine dehydrogenase-like Zn-dependent dehydrogenase